MKRKETQKKYQENVKIKALINEEYRALLKQKNSIKNKKYYLKK